MKRTALFLLTLLLIPSIARAAIVVVAPTSTTPGSLTITADIVFHITRSGNATSFVFDEWVVSDGVQNGSAFLDQSGYTTFPVHHNHTPLVAHLDLFQADNTTFFSGDVSPNDGVLSLVGSFAVVAGDTVTLKAGELIIPPMAGFNPDATQIFSGNMFVADEWHVRLTEVTPVPEPSVTALFFGAGVAAFAFYHRRQKKASHGGH